MWLPVNCSESKPVERIDDYAVIVRHLALELCEQEVLVCVCVICIFVSSCTHHVHYLYTCTKMPIAETVFILLNKLAPTDCQLRFYLFLTDPQRLTALQGEGTHKTRF